MKTHQKPDLLIVLAACVALGVVVTMYTLRAPFHLSTPTVSPSTITNSNQAAPTESHPLDPNTMVKVNEPFNSKQQQDGKRPSVEHLQAKVYQF